MQNDITRGYFEERAQQEGNSPLGQQIRAWLANPERRRRRRRDRGQPARGRPDPHALRRDDAEGRPCRQCACRRARQATVNCRIFPGVAAEGRPGRAAAIAGPKVEVTPDPNYIGMPTPASPLRADVVNAVTNGAPALPRPADARLSGDVDRRERRQLLPRAGHPGLRRRRQLGHLARRRARARPRRAHPVRAMYDDVLTGR